MLTGSIKHPGKDGYFCESVVYSVIGMMYYFEYDLSNVVTFSNKSCSPVFCIQICLVSILANMSPVFAEILHRLTRLKHRSY